MTVFKGSMNSLEKNTSWRVYVGTCWLNANLPNWWKRVNLNSLNLQDQRLCVLGQLYGQIKPLFNMADYGFDAYCDIVNGKRPSHDDMSMELWYLTTEWKRQILLLRQV
jgi:hypothetical protein